MPSNLLICFGFISAQSCAFLPTMWNNTCTCVSQCAFLYHPVPCNAILIFNALWFSSLRLLSHSFPSLTCFFHLASVFCHCPLSQFYRRTPLAFTILSSSRIPRSLCPSSLSFSSENTVGYTTRYSNSLPEPYQGQPDTRHASSRLLLCQPFIYSQCNCAVNHASAITKCNRHSGSAQRASHFISRLFSRVFCLGAPFFSASQLRQAAVRGVHHSVRAGHGRQCAVRK